MTTNRNDCIVRRGNGLQITVPTGRDPVTGKYGRIRVMFDGTMTDARRRRDEIRVQVARGTAVHPDRENVADYVERWIDHRQQIGKVRPRTADVYRGYLRREITPRLGALRLSEVRPAHIQRVLDEALASGLSARSVVQIFRILHAALRTAVQWQLLASNPADGVTPPKVEAATLRVPTPQQVAELLGAVEDRYRPALAVAAGTGLRRGELLALRWDSVEIDTDRPHLNVTGTLQRADGELRVLGPKTERSRRVVPLSASMVAILRGVRSEQRERRLLAGPAWHDGGFVFDTGTGRPVSPETFTKAVLRATRRVGLDGVRLHDLRHAFATMLVSDGTNVRTVSDLLGHSTVGFTLQVYTHGSDEAAIAAIDSVERLLGG